MEVRSRALAEEAASDQYHYNNTYGHYHQQVLLEIRILFFTFFPAQMRSVWAIYRRSASNTNVCQET